MAGYVSPVFSCSKHVRRDGRPLHNPPPLFGFAAVLSPTTHQLNQSTPLLGRFHGAEASFPIYPRVSFVRQVSTGFLFGTDLGFWFLGFRRPVFLTSPGPSGFSIFFLLSSGCGFCATCCGWWKPFPFFLAPLNFFTFLLESSVPC